MSNSNQKQIASLCTSARRALVVSILVLILGLVPLRPAMADPEVPAGTGDNLYVPLIMNDKCTQLHEPTLFGVQLYGDTGQGTAYFSDLRDSGASWLRAEIKWSSVEPNNTTPDAYTWAGADSATAAALEKCYTLVVTLTGNPAWASDFAEGRINKAPIAEFAQFVSAVAERYDGDGIDDAPGSPKVLYLELYNEPDAGGAGNYERWGMYGDEYAALLAAAYPAIKAANPQAKVVFGGIAYDWFTDADPVTPANNGPFIRAFLEDVLKNGGGGYFDVMNFHFYPFFGFNWTQNYPKDGPGLVEKTAALRGVLQKYGLDKSIIITEMGWHNNPGSLYGSDALQVRLVQQLYAQSLAAGVPMAAWWPLGDLGGAYQLNSGLVTNAEVDVPPARKPAFTAYQVLVREFRDVRYVEELDKGPDIKVYHYEDVANARTIYIAWTNPSDPKTVWGDQKPYVDTTRKADIAVPGSRATVYDALWNQVATSTDSADGKTDDRIKITINGDPKYIVVE